MTEPPRDSPAHSSAQLARLVLATFVLVFIATRILVILIMTRKLPDLYVHVGQTHVHHLNFGIIILALTAGFSIFARPRGKAESVLAVAYGIGLALTFDEFGMWLHLDEDYWQRASYDAVAVVAGCLALLTVLPGFKQLRPRQCVIGVIILVALAAFSILLIRTLHDVDNKWSPRLRNLEETGPQ